MKQLQLIKDTQPYASLIIYIIYIIDNGVPTESDKYIVYIYIYMIDNDKHILACLDRRVFWIDVPFSMCPLFVGFC
jgi:hypothetical protein